jgi:hypothetical protein
MHREGEEVRSVKGDLYTTSSRRASKPAAESYTRRISFLNRVPPRLWVSPARGPAPV